MNPSTADWILKYLNIFDEKDLLHPFQNEEDFYISLRDTGFIFGDSMSAIPKKSLGNLKLTKEEITKINLFHALYFYFFQINENATDDEAIKSMLTFYHDIEKGKVGFFQKFSILNSPANNLENILSTRLQESNALFRKNTISLLTYAFLYVDVLAYKYWLLDRDGAKLHYSNLESIILNYCFATLKSKKKKSKYDKLLVEVFEVSPSYTLEKDTADPIKSLQKIKSVIPLSFQEKKYIQDICCLTVWEDFKMDDTEYQYLLELTGTLELENSLLEDSLSALFVFSQKYSEKILLFEYSHPVKQFYKQSSATVKLLILRNKDRLIKEIRESGELMILLGQSTIRDLSTEEKSKVKEQLLNVCKSIPSLTIFLLPGGSVLLPLLMKFIPRLLPSAFQDNRIGPRNKSYPEKEN